MSSRVSANLDPEPVEVILHIREKKYRLRELTIGEYDDLVKKATTKKEGPLGNEIEDLDNVLLLRLMVLKCCVEPKLTPELLSSLPMRMVGKLNQTVNSMHYGDEPETEKEEDSDEGEAKGNSSQPAI